ncbi:hypothetical protein KRR38_08165 [Novosphingobium sp. G106]|uniref:hypothetical protein n=1 Tax=Novosphingobium sp. G106 TaxID=2849500 RepID=UPI001C2D8F3F|nr:hypothetical protein [Novosphingobium sp. G106]MBV1687654.1 hypothetical protein [Novosphingobium sp. G106]
MTAILLSTLFLSIGFLAAAAMAATWQRYGRKALALRGELDACSEWRKVRVRINEVTVRQQATVLRPDFKRPAGRPAKQPALAAA